MVKVIVKPDCGNAPKKEFIKNVMVAFVEGGFDFLMNSVTEDVSWQVVGQEYYEGKAAFETVLQGMTIQPVESLLVDSIITHGREGAAAGTIRFKDGREYGYCDVYKFSGAKGDKIKSITSYVIEL